jgi:hypothetical protein
MASRGRIGGARHITLQDDPIPGNNRIRKGRRGEQSLGIRVIRARVDITAFRQFYYTSKIHDSNAITYVLYDR